MKSRASSWSSTSSKTLSPDGSPEPLRPVLEELALKGPQEVARGLLWKVALWAFMSWLICVAVLFSHKAGSVYTIITSQWVSPSPTPLPTMVLNQGAGPPQVELESPLSDVPEGQPPALNTTEEDSKEISSTPEVLQEPESANSGHPAAGTNDYLPTVEHPAEEHPVNDNPEAEPDAGQPAIKPDEAQRPEMKYQEVLETPPWLKYPHLDGYFHGLRTLVDQAQLTSEYPNYTDPAPFPAPPKSKRIREPQVYSPYNSSSVIKRCYLDADNKIPAPDTFAYQGVPQNMPDPVLGSYSLLGLNSEVCFERFGRYGPYGLGYAQSEGGTGLATDTESSGSESIWKMSPKIDWTLMDWGDAQDRCYTSNEDRFMKLDEERKLVPAPGKMGRTAVVLRGYTGFQWTQHAILNIRALINELSLKSGGEFVVHILLHVRDNDVPIWADDEARQLVLDSYVPPEFHKLVTMWNEAELKLHYPGKFEDAPFNASGEDIFSVFRSTHLPMQVFSRQFPGYDHFWNWELDMRYVGNYYEFFTRLGQWTEQQPRPLLWERNERHYVPSAHKTWEDFSRTVSEAQNQSGREPIFGRLNIEENKRLRFEAVGDSPLPPGCETPDNSNCGVGEPADLITLNPIFDPDQSDWTFGLDVSGYGYNPPRRASIVTASRLSRRLLDSMHEEVWRHHHSMFSEMFPSTVAMYHGLKAVHAPHPVYLERAWSPVSEIDAAFNGGRDHSTSGLGCPFNLEHQHIYQGTTFYYEADFAGRLWRRWLGYSQMDGRGPWDSLFDPVTHRGGQAEESSDEGSGRMCLRSMLIHPVKWEHPSEEPEVTLFPS